MIPKYEDIFVQELNSLTVGFGNVPVVNYKEALCLTVIEAASFILLAYNIRCVGNLITNIRLEGI